MATALDPATVEKIRTVPHFSASHYDGRNAAKLLAQYQARYVDMVAWYRPLDSVESVLDVGTGYGWLAIAWAMTTNAKVIAVDVNAERLVAARQIASVLGVESRIDWRTGALGDLPVADRQADVTFCLEVIEHTGHDCSHLADLSRITRDLLVISTPNRLFPWIKHDTRLPFCHWLPRSARDAYARAFGRLHMQDSNLFWSASEIRRGLAEFRRVSGFMEFPDYQSYREASDVADRDLSWLPRRSRLLLERYYRLASLLGRNSIHVMPNLGATYRRKAVART